MSDDWNTHQREIQDAIEKARNGGYSESQISQGNYDAVDAFRYQQFMQEHTARSQAETENMLKSIGSGAFGDNAYAEARQGKASPLHTWLKFVAGTALFSLMTYLCKNNGPYYDAVAAGCTIVFGGLALVFGLTAIFLLPLMLVESIRTKD